jgi:hypothetical protein
MKLATTYRPLAGRGSSPLSRQHKIRNLTNDVGVNNSGRASPYPSFARGTSGAKLPIGGSVDLLRMNFHAFMTRTLNRRRAGLIGTTWASF